MSYLKARQGVEEMRWYRFGYIGPTVGAVEDVYPGEPMRLADVKIRPTTDEEMARGGMFEGCETVARLLWEPIEDAARRLDEVIG